MLGVTVDLSRSCSWQSQQSEILQYIQTGIDLVTKKNVSFHAWMMSVFFLYLVVAFEELELLLLQVEQSE